MEHFIPDNDNDNNNDYHGRNGYITTSRPDFIDSFAPEFVSAAVQSGLPLTQDFNEPGGRAGVGYYHFNIKEGVRDSAARAMLSSLLGVSLFICLFIYFYAYYLSIYLSLISWFK
jgi:choline dehydrogenase